MQHVDEGTIHAWLDGALDPDEAARVEQHARECATCAAAVAEARGLVAGASRILSALDHTPGGVVPRGLDGSSGAASSGSVPLGSTRRPGSLWRTLHFTPARAAAAAVLILAAGSVMVYRHAPRDIPEIDTEAGPQALEPERRPSTAASQLPAAAAPPTPAPAAAPERAAAKLGAPAQNMAVRGDRAVRATDTSAVAQPVPQPSREMAAEKSAVIAPSVASTSNVAPSAPQAAIVGGARPAARKAASGGVAGMVVTSRAEAAPRARAPSPQIAIAGCYAIEADSLAGLPHRIALDSSAMRGAGFTLDSASPRRDSIARSRASLADASAVPALRTHPVRIFDRATFGYAAAASAYWQPIASDGLRLYIPGSATMPIDLRASSPTTFTGTTTIANRPISITLQRLPDCPAR